MPQFCCALLFPTRAAFLAPADTSQGTLEPILNAAEVYEEKVLLGTQNTVQLTARLNSRHSLPKL